MQTNAPKAPRTRRPRPEVTPLLDLASATLTQPLEKVIPISDEGAAILETTRAAHPAARKPNRLPPKERWLKALNRVIADLAKIEKRVPAGVGASITAGLKQMVEARDALTIYPDDVKPLKLKVVLDIGDIVGIREKHRPEYEGVVVPQGVFQITEIRGKKALVTQREPTTSGRALIPLTHLFLVRPIVD